MSKPKPFEKKKETKDVKFNTRQHRLCDYLLAKLEIHNEYMDKIDILWDLKEYYFDEHTLWFISKEKLLKARHNQPEYVKLTNDVTFINMFGEIRQSRAGTF